MEEEKITSEDIFYQFCQAKKNNASDFMNDYILYQLNIANPFDDEKYQNYIQYILDFMVASDSIFNFYLKYLTYPKEYYSKEYFFSNILKRNLILIMKIYVVFFIVFFFLISIILLC